MAANDNVIRVGTINCHTLNEEPGITAEEKRRIIAHEFGVLDVISLQRHLVENDQVIENELIRHENRLYFAYKNQNGRRGEIFNSGAALSPAFHRAVRNFETDQNISQDLLRVNFQIANLRICIICAYAPPV